MSRVHWLIIVIGILVFATPKASARCMGLNVNLIFFIEAKYVCLIKVDEIRLEGMSKVFKVTVIKNFKGNMPKEYYIYTHNSQAHWHEDAEAYLQKNGVYIVEPYVDSKGISHLSACSYIVPDNASTFKHDSICFSSFVSNNVYVSNEFYKGQVVNGKPDGKWREYNDSGTYRHGVRVGNWIENGKVVVYKNGRHYKWQEEWSHDTIIVHDGNTSIVYYKEKVLETWKRRKIFGDVVTKFENELITQIICFNNQRAIRKNTFYNKGKLISVERYRRWDNEKRQNSNTGFFDPEECFYFGLSNKAHK